jgi:hypothetical protein
MASLSFYNQFGTSNVRVILHVAGVATVQDDGLALEWRVSQVEHLKMPQRWTRGEVQRLLIPWTELESVVYRGRILRAGRLVLRARSLTTLEPLTGSAGVFWSAQVARSERERARDFADAAAAFLAAASTRRLRA